MALYLFSPALVPAAVLLAACHVTTVSTLPPSELSPSRVDTLAVQAPGLTIADRTVRVYLPPGYQGGSARYPVLYMQDGQNLFTAGWFGDWRVDETVDSLVRSGSFAGLIVVGIDNSARRWDEYSPWINPRMHAWFDSRYAQPTQGGEGDAYLDFLARTLKPEIDRRYRTMPDAAHTGIGGSSMGGLISLHAGFTRPAVFGRVLAMSLAVWFAESGGPWLSANGLIVELSGRKAPAEVRFYVDVGTAERSRDTEPEVTNAAGQAVSYPRVYVEGADAVAAALRAGGAGTDRLRLVVDSVAPHQEAAWARRLGPALLWLFGNKR